MLARLDHVVILVHDLARAVRDYGSLGFTVTPGGEHADGLTHNALIPFRDGSYLELVAFLDPDDPQDNVWGWRPFLSCGGGLIDYCAASDDLRADVRRLENLGFDVNGPTDGGRRLPDGAQIRWRWSSLLTYREAWKNWTGGSRTGFASDSCSAPRAKGVRVVAR